MNKQEFTTMVTEELQKMAWENGYQIEIEPISVKKMQDPSYDGICFRRYGSPIGACINLDDAYEAYDNGMTFIAIITRLYDQILDALKQAPEINVADISDYEKAKNSLYIDLVSYETNKEMLKNIPFKQISDMAIYCRLLMRQDANGIMSIVVNNMMLKTFGVSNEQLFSDALCNSTKIRPSELCSMYSALEKFMNEFPGGLMDNMPLYDDLLPMYVLSNKEHLNGAATLFYPGTMQLVASEFGGSYYILPSSIHEVILIPDDGDMDVEFLLSMVVSINKDGVLPEDKLTDSIYYYDAEKNEFSRCNK